MTTKNKSVVKAMRFRPDVSVKIQELADVNGVSFTTMVNLLLNQALKDPKLLTK